MLPPTVIRARNGSPIAAENVRRDDCGRTADWPRLAKAYDLA
jgi:hypothetical protein